MKKVLVITMFLHIMAFCQSDVDSYYKIISEGPKYAYWYNTHTSNNCIITATTPEGYAYMDYESCEKGTTVYKWAIEYREALKITSCKEGYEFLSHQKDFKYSLYEYLDLCVKYTTIYTKPPKTYYTYCSLSLQDKYGYATRPLTCNYDAVWFAHKREE